MELISIIFVFLIMLGIAQCVGRYLWHYKVSKNSIQICLFYFIPVFYIPLAKIIEVKKISTVEMLLKISTLHWVNKIYSKEYVLVSWESWFLGKMIISPDVADGFIEEVLNMKGAKGG